MRLEFEWLLDCLPKHHKDSLFMPSFEAILNIILSFVQDSDVIYEKRMDNRSKAQYIARVANAIMGAGKSTALKLVAIWAIQSNIPLLCVFNNKDNLKSFFSFVSKFAHEYEYFEGVMQAENKNFNDVAHLLSKYTVVGITQQRFRDIALGYGDFSVFKSYDKLVLQFGHNNRTIIFDEMPILIDGEIYDIGGQNNIVKWFDEMTKNVNLEDKVIRQARLTISYLFNCELNEVVGDDHVSIPTKRLIRHIEGSEKEEQLIKVLDYLNKNVETKYLNRYKWFERLLKKDEVGIVNRDGKQSVILCADFIDYTNYGNVLVLDGTADITKSIYRHAGFELISLPNFHNYKERLTLWHREINTSKESRKREEVHQIIASDLSKLDEPTLPLPLKQDLKTYFGLGVITNKQFQKFFQGRTVEDNSLALNLLNTTGKNELAEYNNLALLSLPIRHPSYYKLFALAMYGTATDVSLMDTISGRQVKESIKWFVDEKVQEVYQQLVLMDFSQIIHRTSLRNINSDSEVNIYLYNNRLGWAIQLQKLYQLPNQNVNIHRLSGAEELIKKAEEIAIEVSSYLKEKQLYGVLTNPGTISVNIREWLTKNWADKNRRDVITQAFNIQGVSVIEEKVGRKVHKKFLLEV